MRSMCDADAGCLAINYHFVDSFRTSDLEAEMLMNLNKKAWSEGLKTGNFIDNDKVIRATSKFREED